MHPLSAAHHASSFSAQFAGLACQAAEASLALSSRSNSLLQEQLQSSLAQLDGQLAVMAVGRSQPLAEADAEPAPVAVLTAADDTDAAVQPCEPAQRAGVAAPPAQHGGQEEAEGALGQQAVNPAAKVETGQQASMPPPVATEQQPLQWRLRPRCLAGALNAAAAPSAASAPATDSVCHINIGNVGKACPMPAPVLQPAVPAGCDGQQSAAGAAGLKQQSVLPPLCKQPLWPGSQQGKAGAGAPSAPLLRTAARAAARPARMQPLHGADASSVPWQQPAGQQQQWQAQPQWSGWQQQQQQEQQEQQQEGWWPAWGQQQQQAQAQWWQQFPPGWQQYQQPLQHWGGTTGGLVAAGYGGAWHWAQ